MAETEVIEPAPNWGRRALLALVGIVVLIVAGFAASATVPRWWSQRIGEQVDGSITQGVLVVLFYGFLFTLLPILVLAAVLRWRRTPKAIALAVVAALLLAVPNLMTLGIVLGTGNAAHAAERTLDVNAPAFRGASLAGVLLAVTFAMYVAGLMVSRRRAQAGERRAQQAREQASTPAPPSDSPDAG
jgi:heme/copper-type cytochrome/quinol oxidase subunit 1